MSDSETAHLSARADAPSYMSSGADVVGFWVLVGAALVKGQPPAPYIRSIDGEPVPEAWQQGCIAMLPGAHSVEIESVQPAHTPFEGENTRLYYAFFTAERGHKYLFILKRQEEGLYLWLRDMDNDETIWGVTPPPQDDQP